MLFCHDEFETMSQNKSFFPLKYLCQEFFHSNEKTNIKTVKIVLSVANVKQKYYGTTDSHEGHMDPWLLSNNTELTTYEKTQASDSPIPKTLRVNIPVLWANSTMGTCFTASENGFLLSAQNQVP
jgi:hypothetical protein